MSLGAATWLWGLLLIPPLLALFGRGERRARKLLSEFVAARLAPQLAGNVNRFRRTLKFGLQLLALALAFVSLAQPRFGYTFEDARRKGIDLFIAIDTSRSMLSNDVQPNRLEQVKLAAQDLINQLEGDRVGLIAFAGRAFVQAPLTIDYDAVVESINDLDTKTIPEGGTNISEAINLADKTYGKSATGNRALVIFTDGEELSGDAVKAAKAAAENGAKIFTIGIGTAQGSLIPIRGDEGSTSFVKDSKGQVVKSKLDENRLRQIAQATGGLYLHLDNGPRTMQQLFNQGLAKIQAGDIDVRLSRRPIERYAWPLGAAAVALALSILIRDRRRSRQLAPAPTTVTLKTAATAALLLFGSLSLSLGSAPGLDAYQTGKFNDAYTEFQETLKAHPLTPAVDKLHFDSGAAAYKMKEYNKALESFSQALLSPDTGLQSKSHYNLGNTLYQRGETQKSDERKLGDWTNALQQYEETLKLNPQDQDAKDNYDYVKKKIEELKKKQQQPPPQQNKSQNQKQNKQDKGNQQQQDQQSQPDRNQSQDQQSQSQNQPGSGQNNKPDQSHAKNQSQSKNQRSENPSPSPGPSQEPSPQNSGGKSEEKNRSSSDENAPPSPTPGEGESPSPSPANGEGTGEGENPSPAPTQSPTKKFAGDIKAAPDENQSKPNEQAKASEAELEKEGEMSEKQAEALLQSMKNEEARVQLDERRPVHRVYNDW